MQLLNRNIRSRAIILLTLAALYSILMSNIAGIGCAKIRDKDKKKEQDKDTEKETK